MKAANGGYVVSGERLGGVYSAIKSGAGSIEEIAKKTCYSRSSVFNAIQALMFRKLVYQYSTRRSGDANGRTGKRIQLYRVNDAPPDAPMPVVEFRTFRRRSTADTCALIRSALRAGPLDMQQIATRTNTHPETVRCAIGALCGRDGDVITYLQNRRRYFKLSPTAKDITPEARPFRVAGRITVGRGAYWGAGLV